MRIFSSIAPPPTENRNLSNTVSKKIADNNPWYTGKQTPEAAHQKRVSSERFAFIIGEIARYGLAVGDRPVRVLDAGCGDGFLLKEMTKLSVECYGFDYNPLRVGHARDNAPGATVAQKDLMNLGVVPEFFDVIAVSQVLEHVDDDEKVISNLVEILKPGGLLIAGVPNEGCVLGMLRNTLFEPSISRTTDHVRFYTDPIIRNKLEKAGLTVERVYYESFMWPHQIIGSRLESWEWGHRLSKWLGRTIKAQCGGFYFVCTKR
jgi:2-polyprenyl-3-methyl-5-hydroxy-6-metoxy-1,4-benzoquinol methylase